MALQKLNKNVSETQVQNYNRESAKESFPSDICMNKTTVSALDRY